MSPDAACKSDENILLGHEAIQIVKHRARL
jgi:hypothetical protein